jgi:hypothetical protein
LRMEGVLASAEDSRRQEKTEDRHERRACGLPTTNIPAIKSAE